MLSTRRQQETRIIRSPCVQARSEENIKPLQNKSTHERRYTTRTSEEKNEREENSRETAEDPDFDEYYDIEEKEEDKDEDEGSETNFNKNASTYARTQTSLPIGRPEQQRSCPENRPERFQPRDWKDNSSDSEDSCLLYFVMLYISYFAELSLVVLYMFYLKLWINNFTEENGHYW